MRGRLIVAQLLNLQVKSYIMCEGEQYYKILQRGKYKMMEKSRWAMIKQECIVQSQKFIRWDQKRNYSIFHSSHYDWWTFPIDQPSSHGTKYMVTPKEIDLLSKDKLFIQALETNAELVCKAWGYDLRKGQEIKGSSMEQRWQKWPIRLFKMARSLQLFELSTLYMNSVKYALSLINRGENFRYSGRRLDEYFIERKDMIQQLGQKQQGGDWQKMQNQGMKCQAIMEWQRRGKINVIHQGSKIEEMNNWEKGDRSNVIKQSVLREMKQSVGKVSQSNQGMTDQQFKRPKTLNKPLQNTKVITMQKKI